jgi:hypothetical protein
MHSKRSRNVIGMLAFGHALNCKDAHFFERIVSQASAISFHERSFQWLSLKHSLFVWKLPDS